MDRRMLLAILLILVVAVLPSILFSPEERARPSPVADPAATPETVVVERPVPTPAPTLPPVAAPVPDPDRPEVTERRVAVTSDIYRYEFSSLGARLVGAVPLKYRSFTPGQDTIAQLIPENSEFLAYGVVVGRDTVWFADWEFTPDRDSLRVQDGDYTLNWTAGRGGIGIQLSYRFSRTDHWFDVSGEITGLGPDGGLLLLGMGPRLRSIDADTVADIRTYGVVTKARSTERLDFSSIDPGERRELPGPFEWVAIKSRYFVAAAFTIDEGLPRLGGAVALGGARNGRSAAYAHVTASLVAPQGRFSHSMYVGPQEHHRLKAIGHDFDDVNPYGWIFRPIIRPFAQFIMIILLWMHEKLNLAYGWVLVLFGVMVRVVLWPLNQKAMRSAMAMQAIQPQMKAIQDKYKNRKDPKDQQKMQQEIFALYKEHKVNPLGGCVPMLIPMPILFALFFVFMNTIEFRGVPFMWLPDLSRPDPFYIIPVLMGASMFGVSKLGQMGMPPNPQAKMMLYIFPPMLTLLFLNFASGLNLYYTVMNIASLPQQWLIARERLRRQDGEKGTGKRET